MCARKTVHLVEPQESPEPVLATRLTRDLRDAAKQLRPSEVRYLVDLYYTVQEYRKAANNQTRIGEEPTAVLAWFAAQHTYLETDIKKALDAYTDEHPIGIWCKAVPGIGPVIAAGLLAHIEISRSPTVGALWRFAGLDPSATWAKGQKRPWNARLKVLCWKIGESFVKISNNPKDIYGQVYRVRKEEESKKNEALLYKDQAEAILAAKRIGKDTDAYKWYSVGKLPPAQIHARAKRYAVKLFLSHLFEVWRKRDGLEAPEAYCFAHLGHVHKIPPPGVKP